MPAIDKFFTAASSATAPIIEAAAVTPSDTETLEYAARGIYVGVAGDVKLTTLGGSTVTFKNMPVGFWPIRATMIWATGTTATDIVAGW